MFAGYHRDSRTRVSLRIDQNGPGPHNRSDGDDDVALSAARPSELLVRRPLLLYPGRSKGSGSYALTGVRHGKERYVGKLETARNPESPEVAQGFCGSGDGSGCEPRK